MSQIDKGVHIFYRRVIGGSPILSFYERKEQLTVSGIGSSWSLRREVRCKGFVSP
ncbi:BQ5605_C010g06103 [Microbotryum silenes-dioicae]|uniref:BQ5605_C010g06103 protein n=1 Tax=Microbotryum silenes-dioicae TaxID=796604 RepID=A0A2X0LQL8_9BASI|nr:BQ5605_C010g06103 [Microbotryum silenes-dioicae]